MTIFPEYLKCRGKCDIITESLSERHSSPSANIGKYKTILSAALNFGVTGVEAKEIVYQVEKPATQ